VQHWLQATFNLKLHMAETHSPAILAREKFKESLKACLPAGRTFVKYADRPEIRATGHHLKRFTIRLRLGAKGLTTMRRVFTKTRTKRVSRMKKSPEPKSVGTQIAEKERAKANAYSDRKREQLLDRGMALIYGNPGHVKSNRNRG
jgi:hypothetical protein